MRESYIHKGREYYRYAFETLEELEECAEDAGACAAGMFWLQHFRDYGAGTMETLFTEIPIDYRLWCVASGFRQFATPEWLACRSFHELALVLAYDPKLFLENRELFEEALWKARVDSTRHILCVVKVLPEVVDLFDWSELVRHVKPWLASKLIQKVPKVLDLLVKAGAGGIYIAQVHTYLERWNGFSQS